MASTGFITGLVLGGIAGAGLIYYWYTVMKPTAAIHARYREFD